MSSSPAHQVYQVEHLATFASCGPDHEATTPKMALQRLFSMEKTSGIWTQRMAIQMEGRDMKIIDGDSGEAVERFPVTLIQHPTAFSHHNHIYDNILIFTVQHPDENQGELHIFQCNSHLAQQIVDDLHHWMNRHSGAPDPNGPNVNVKETVHVFNAIAAQRETKSTSPVGPVATSASAMRISMPTPPVTGGANSSSRERDNMDSRSITTTSSMDSTGQPIHRNGPPTTNNPDQSLTNERYVSILNHCFDDIERFIIRLQHSAAAMRELQTRNHKRSGSKGGGGNLGDGLLAIRARGPNEEDFFEILSKFKLAFNLLAKLKGCIHDPNAPELVHFLFTPLAIIIEAARSNGPGAVDPSLVGVPFLNPDAIELLSNCCTSKEYDLWQSLAINWTQPVRQLPLHPSRMIPVTFQPVFTDGWAPTISEPELMGFASSSSSLDAEEDTIPPPILPHRDLDGVVSDDHRGRNDRSHHRNNHHHREGGTRNNPVYDDSDVDDMIMSHGGHGGHHHPGPSSSAMQSPHGRGRSGSIGRGPSSDLMVGPSSGSHGHGHSHHQGSSSGHHRSGGRGDQSTSPSPIGSDGLDRDGSTPPGMNGIPHDQSEWVHDLQGRGCKIVKVLFPRTANNEKELTVSRGEILEVMDDSRKWWKARNSRGQIAHVPHTIVSEWVPSGGRDSANAASGLGSPNQNWIRKERQVSYEGISLQFIVSHLFNRGFLSDFLSNLMAGLIQDQKWTRLTPKQVLLQGNHSLLQPHLTRNELDAEEIAEFYKTLYNMKCFILKRREINV